MKFYDCATAPSPRRVRIFIAEKELDIPVVEVAIGDGEQHGDAFQSLNPHRTVPVLQLDDGSCLTSTAGIWHYLEMHYPEPPLMGFGSAQRGRVIDLEWRIEVEGFMAVGESFRNKARSFANRGVTGRHSHAQIPALVDRGRARATECFQWLDTLLQDNEFLAGEQYTIADITALATIDFAKWIKLDLPEDAERLRDWYARVSARPSATAFGRKYVGEAEEAPA